MQLMGILSGTLFGVLVTSLKDWLLSVSYVVFGLSILMIALSSNLLLLALGAMLSGFSYNVVLNLVFSRAAEQTPPALLTLIMTLILMGCNIGGATASILPRLLENLYPSSTGPFALYAFGCVLISLTLILQQLLRKKST